MGGYNPPDTVVRDRRRR